MASLRAASKELSCARAQCPTMATSTLHKDRMYSKSYRNREMPAIMVSGAAKSSRALTKRRNILTAATAPTTMRMRMTILPSPLGALSHCSGSPKGEGRIVKEDISKWVSSILCKLTKISSDIMSVERLATTLITLEHLSTSYPDSAWLQGRSIILKTAPRTGSISTLSMNLRK